MHAILDYGLGNIASIEKAVKKAGFPVRVSRDPALLEKADSIILPGVGSFRDAMRRLHSHGLVDLLNRLVIDEGKRFLGICLGMQLLADLGHEDGETEGLGWISGEVVKLDAPGLRVPHMGWNEISPAAAGAALVSGLPDDNFYFMHSYHFVARDPASVMATTSYGREIVACIARDNIVAAQFHPEKSQAAGIAFLKNVLG